jgi:hypothetical protein
MKTKASVSLADKGVYYALVRATNGNGITSIGASLPLVVDLQPPVVTLTAPKESPGTDRIVVDVSAKDAVSGVARYRAKVWEVKGSTSELDMGEVRAVPVMGWASSGTFKSTSQSSAQYLALPPPEGNAWLTTQWQKIGAGAPPAQADIQVVITGFPGSGIQVGKSYRVAIEVESGAGVAAQSSEYAVKVVAAAPSYKFAPRYQLKK